MRRASRGLDEVAGLHGNAVHIPRFNGFALGNNGIKELYECGINVHIIKKAPDGK